MSCDCFCNLYNIVNKYRERKEEDELEDDQSKLDTTTPAPFDPVERIKKGFFYFKTHEFEYATINYLLILNLILCTKSKGNKKKKRHKD